MQSLKINGIFYAILGVMGLVFVIYLVAEEGFNWGDLVIFLIALSNSWGIFLIIMLLGYGLVSLP